MSRMLWVWDELRDCARASFSHRGPLTSIAMLCALFVTPTAVQANSFTLRLGYYAPRGDSRLWAENVATFDYVVNDFNWISGGGEFDWELNEYVDFAMGVDGYSRTVVSHYRDFVRDDGTEVVHEARLQVVPVTFGARFFPVGKFHVLLPYVAGGFGLYPFEYRERGEFIDFATGDIFGANYFDSGVGAGGYVAAGIEASITPSFGIGGEYRRHFVSATHGEDFGAYGDFDLDATQASFGVTFRF